MIEKRIYALVLAAIILMSMLIPLTASAMDRVTIESDPDDATPRYFEYLNGSGDWVGLKTPRHYIVETGEIAYCLQHKMSSPHSGIDFEEADLADWYDTRTLVGLQIILEYGYPCDKPDNLNDDEARYATANAIRFWLSEQGDPDFWGFTNRRDNPDNLRAAAGCEAVLDWADELLEHARNLELMQHKVHFSPANMEFNYQGGYFVGSTSVSLENCNGGYTLNRESLPAGTVVEGFTGRDGDRLTIKIPASGNGNKSISLSANGIDNRITPNIFLYVTNDSATQNLISISSGGYHPAGSGTFSFSTPAFAKIRVSKHDAETGGTPQGDASLYNARFEIRDSGGNVVDTMSAAGSQSATSKELPLGTYKVYEKSPAPEGYILNPNPVTVTLTDADMVAEIKDVVVTDQVKKGYISIVKFGSHELTGGADPDPDIKPPLANVEFEIRLKSSGALYATMKTDADGKATSPLLPYGTYTVSERSTSANEGYLKVEPFDVFVSENTKTYSYILEDKAIELMLQIVKVDSVTGNRVPVAGNTFRIEDGEGNEVSFEMLYPQPHTISEFTTDESGTLYLPGKLSEGDYTLYEVEAGEPYLLNGTPLPFTVSENQAVNRVITVEFANEVAKGKITIEKHGEVLTGADTEETEYGTKYIPQFSDGGLNAVFSVYAAENIGTPDGTVYYEEGEKVDEITVENGTGESVPLYLGKYLVIEESVEGNFVLEQTPHEVVLSYADQVTPVTNETLELENQRQKGHVQLKKRAEHFSGGLFYKGAGEGFVFGLYAAEDIQGIIPKDGLVDILVTDADGFAETSADIPLAGFYLKELKAVNSQYEILDATYPVDVMATDQSSGDFTDDSLVQEPLLNTMYRGKVSVIKSDAADANRKLQGIIFEVVDEDGRVVSVFETDAQGYGESGMLLYAKYVLREKETKDGFILSEREYPVVIDGTHQIVEISISNQPTAVKVIKVDENGEPLTGAGFTVKTSGFLQNALPLTKVKDGLYRYDPAGTETAAMVGEDGTVLITELPFADFWLEESVVPENYFPAAPVAFTVTKETAYATPLELRIENAPFVKLGLDTDQYAGPIALILLGSGIAFFATLTIRRWRKKREIKIDEDKK